jgi:hypothetical protein
MPLPGGALALADAAGVDVPVPRARLLLDIIRLIHAIPPGGHAPTDALRQRVLAHLDAVATLPPDSASNDVPLPLAPERWISVLSKGGAGRQAGARRGAVEATAASVLSDRNASFLYTGLMALDGPTLQWMTSDEALLATIFRGHAGIFAMSSGSLEVRDGRVAVPGGREAVPLWESLVGASTSEPGAFVLKLLSTDSGQLAYLYDTIARLDHGGRKFVLGLWISVQPSDFRAASPGTRLIGRHEGFAELYQAFRLGITGWDGAAAPFRRLLYDPAQFLLQVRATADGLFDALPRADMWEAVFASDTLSDAAALQVMQDYPEGPIDASRLIRYVAVRQHVTRRERFSTVLFGQRVFADVPAAALSDVVVALRAHREFPALTLTLERMGVKDPSVYVLAVQHARSIASITDTNRAATALAQFQGALALVERARFNRHVDHVRAGRLVTLLAGSGLSSQGEYLGQVAAWLRDSLLPALDHMTRPGYGAEEQVLRMLSGAPDEGGRDEIEWEGVRYRIDPVHAELQRLRRVRQRQADNSLDTVLEIARAAAALIAVPASPEAVAELRRSLAEAAADLVQPAGFEGVRRIPDVLSAVRNVVADLEGAGTTAALQRAPALGSQLMPVVDTLLAGTLASLAYAPALGDPDGPALLAGNPAALHDFDLQRIGRPAYRTAWALPTLGQGPSANRQVRGSLLALDVGLGRLALRRLWLEPPSQAPRLHDNDRNAFIESVLLTSPADLTDADRDVLVEAMRRGADIVGQLADRPEVVERIAADRRISRWRRNALGWMLKHEPDEVADLFSLGELLFLGAGPSSAIGNLDAWGTSGLSASGCLCSQFPSAQPWEGFAGREGTGLIATRVPDLKLRIAQALADLRLPADFTPYILAAATQDLIDESRPVHHDDWATVVRQARTLTRERFEDYISALTAGGPLVPAKTDASRER